MRNDCVEREKIFALAQDMLSGREQQNVNAHVEACEGCRDILQSYRRIDSVLDEWSPATEPSPWFEARLRSAIASRAAGQSGSFWGLKWSRWMAAPALASLLLVASVVLLRNHPATNGPGSGTHGTVAVNASSGEGTGTRGVAVAENPVRAQLAQPQTASQELKMYQNLPVLEDYDMLADFDVISELPKGSHKLAD